MTYAEQIKHPLWQKKRLEVLTANEYKCEFCGNDGETLHIHHSIYKKGAMIWDYKMEELQCLCDTCHQQAHSLMEELKSALSTMDNSLKMMVLGYATSMIGPFFKDDENFMQGYIDGVRTEDKYLSDAIRHRWAKQ